MDNPDTWWGHLPVISKRCSAVGEHWEWHLKQLDAAIARITKLHPSAIATIPRQGFHLRASRQIDRRDDGKYIHLLAVGICEDFDDTVADFDLVIVAFANNTLRKGSVVETVDAILTRKNAYNPIFEELVFQLPSRWKKYAERTTVQG